MTLVYAQSKLPEYRTVRHPFSPVPDWKKLTMPEPDRYRNKTTQSGIFLVRYRTEMTDTGIPMPALVFWMPMPTYAFSAQPIETIQCERIGIPDANVIYSTCQSPHFRLQLRVRRSFSVEAKRCEN
jgi:hypothetical protein